MDGHTAAKKWPLALESEISVKIIKDFSKKLIAIFRSQALSSVFRWSKCVRGSVALICVLDVICALCSLGTTLVTKELVDGAVSSSIDAVWRFGIMLAVLSLGGEIIGTLESMVDIKATAKLQRFLQKMYLDNLLAKNYAEVRKHHSGEMVNRFFSDVSAVKNGIMSIPVSLISSSVNFIGAAVILISMDWRIMFLLVLGGFVGLGIVLLFRQPMKKRHRENQEAEDALHASVQETLENIRLVKASASENRMFKKINLRQAHLERMQLRQGHFSLFMNTGLGLLLDISWLICMIGGCVLISRSQLTYGSLAAMIQLIGRIEGPIMNAFSLAGKAYGVVSSAERIKEFTDLPEDTPGEPLSDFDEIRVKDVSFRYDDGTEDVLYQLDFSVRRGDFVALTGISGGGKTSLFLLLLGIFQPTEGKIEFLSGAKSVVASRGTRGLFAYVPQGNTLFSGTLRENLMMFNDEATEEEIRAAVQCACISELVEENGLDAMLGERGLGLSEGQAQRVAIARALLSNAPILLLDESTSALDDETEARLLENISALRNKTCLIVTHRKAALAICNRQLHIAKGRITQL